MQYGDGWLAPRSDPVELRDPIAALQDAMAEASRGPAEVAPLAALDLDDPPAAVARVHALREVGATGLIYYGRYDTEDGLAARLEQLATHVMPYLKA